MYKLTACCITVLSLVGTVAHAQTAYQFPPNPASAPSYSGSAPTLPYYYPYGAYPSYPSYSGYPSYPNYPTAPAWSYPPGYTPYAYAPGAVVNPVPAPALAAPLSTQTPYYASPYDPNRAAQPGPRSAPSAAAQPKKASKPWGDTRYIWPDFYTEFTDEAWDKLINAPNELGYMPGGWRFPSFSAPDPVTVGDAVANQVPPIMEEVPNFMNFTN